MIGYFILLCENVSSGIIIALPVFFISLDSEDVKNGIFTARLTATVNCLFHLIVDCAMRFCKKKGNSVQ